MSLISIPMVQVEPTTRCNLRCTYCTNKEPVRDMELSTLQHIVGNHPSITIYKLQGLGEPMLATNILEMCKYLKSRGKYITTITNGTIFRPEVFKNMDQVIFSIDTLDPDKFKLNRPNTNLYDILHNMHSTAEYVRVGVNQVISANTTRDDTEDIRELCKTFGYMLSQPRIENWNLEEDPAVVADRRKNGIVPPRKYTCQWGKTMFYYDAHGRLHPCCIRMNDKYIVEDMPEFVRNRTQNEVCRMCPD